jgi:hypothetical protein
MIKRIRGITGMKKLSRMIVILIKMNAAEIKTMIKTGTVLTGGRKKKERKKFVNDCKEESAENVAADKLNDFCSCMLTQAQRYYPNYKQMDENSNEESDRKILDECLGKYTDEDGDH